MFQIKSVKLFHIILKINIQRACGQISSITYYIIITLYNKNSRASYELDISYYIKLGTLKIPKNSVGSSFNI